MLGNMEFDDIDAFRNDQEQELGQTFSTQIIENNQQQIMIEEAKYSDNQFNLYKDRLDDVQKENFILKQVS